MIIEDGTGSGSKAKVDSGNHLEVHASTKSGLEELNENGVVWALPMDALAPSGATKFFYLTYTGQLRLGIAGIRIASSVAGVFRFLKVTGTPVGGTAIVAVPTNLGSTKLPLVTVLNGASITGLADAGLLLPSYLQANVNYELELPARWYLTSNTALAIQAPGAAAVNGNLLVYEEDDE